MRTWHIGLWYRSARKCVSSSPSFRHGPPRSILFLITLIALLSSAAESRAWWTALYNRGSPVFTYYLGDNLAYVFEFAVNEDTGPMTVSYGLGTTQNGSGWTWRAAEWSRMDGSNNRVWKSKANEHRFTSTGSWYYSGRFVWTSGGYTEYASGDWQSARTTLNAGSYFSVQALGNPSSVSATANSGSQITVSWTKWSSRNVLIVRRAGSAVTWTPTQGASYSNGQAVDADHTVVRGSDSGSSVADSGLTAGTTYHYKIYTENNGYYSAGVTTSASTPFEAPSTQAHTITFNNERQNQYGVAWTSGNGSRRIVVAREGNAVNWTPVNASTYTANNNFSSATDQGNGNKVVYEGTGSSFTLSGLTAGATYHLRVYEYNGTGANTMYLTSTASGNPATQATLTPPSNLGTANNANRATRIDLSWTPWNSKNVLIVRKADSAVTWSPTQGTGYSSGQDVGSGHTVVRGSQSGSSHTDSGLSPNTVYHYAFFSENFSYYSTPVTIIHTTQMPQARNWDGDVNPSQPSTLYVGDNGTFRANTWGSIEGNWGQGRVVTRFNHADLSSGTLVGSYGDFVDVIEKELTSPRFNQAGTWYWAIQMNYGSPYGNGFWYKNSNPNWTNMSANGQNATLSVEVLPLQNPGDVSATQGTQPATRVDLSWTRWNNRNVMIVRRAGTSVTWTPTPGTGYSNGQNVGDGHVVVRASQSGTTYEDTGLTPGATYYYAFYSENFSHYSDGVEISHSTIMPRARNTDGDATPEQPAAIYLGDTNRTFGLNAWGNIESTANNGRARLWISTTANLSDGEAGPWTTAANTEHRQPLSRQFTQTGTWYWGVQMEYGSYGNGFWYKSSQTAWSQMSANGDNASLSVEVLALGEPTGVSATETSSSAIQLDWSKWNDRNVLIARRKGAAVAWTPTPGVRYEDSADVGNDTVIIRRSTHLTTWEDTGLESDTTYHYRIFSENYRYYSDGVTASATTESGPTAPILESPSATAITTSGATLGATITSTGGSAITSRGTVWGTEPNPTDNALAASGTDLNPYSHSRGSMPAGTLIYFRGYAVNGIGTGYSPDGSFWTVPNAPTAQAAGGIGGSGFTAHWDAATGATSYRLDVATDSGFTSMISGQNNRNVGSGTSASVTGLNPETTYYYRVRAVNSGGTSAHSGTITVQTTAAQAPEPPPAEAASSISDTSFMAAWSASAGADGYRLDVSTSPDFTSYVSGYQNRAVGATSEPVTGLSSTQNYYYRVRAYNNEGTSASSDIVGVMRKTIQPGFQMIASPALSDLSFGAESELGAALASALNAASTSGAADKIHIWDPADQTFLPAIWLHTSGEWRDSSTGQQTTLSLDRGQGFYVERVQGSSTRLDFTGLVGNTGATTVRVYPGLTILGLSEGRRMTIQQAFSDIASGTPPVASWQGSQADQVVLQNANGSWRRIQRTPDGWYDWGKSPPGINNTFMLEPGMGYYYQRQPSEGTMDIRF